MISFREFLNESAKLSESEFIKLVEDTNEMIFDLSKSREPEGEEALYYVIFSSIGADAKNILKI